MVVDASALVELLLRTSRAGPVERVLADPATDAHAPALCDVEVAAALRRLLQAGTLTAERAGFALDDYLDLPVARHGHTGLLPRMLALRENMSAYDAAYVALAERLDASLLTADRRLRRAAAAHTAVPIVG